MFSVASNSLNAGAINIDTNYTVTLNLDYIGYGTGKSATIAK